MEFKGFEVEGVIKVDNVRIYGIEESIIASGYPMQTETFNMNEINLKDKDLWKKYDVKISNPYEIVKKVFKPFEYSAIAQRIDQLSAGEIPSKAEVQEKAKQL